MSPDADLRVLLAPSAYYPNVGGIEETTRRLALELSALGHEPLILTNRWPAGTAEAETLDGLPVRRVELALPAARARALARLARGGPAAARRIVALARSFRPDVVHVVGAGPFGPYAALLAPVIGGRLVVTSQGEVTADAHGGFERSATLRAGLRGLLRRAAVVTAPSWATLTELEARFPFSAPSAVVPNGVDAAELELASEGPDPAAPYVLAVARLVPQKGLDVLLDAFARGGPEGWRLLVAGEGPLRDGLELRARRLGLAGRVRFVGAAGRPQLARLLAGAGIFALPSRQEAFGIALLEAMAAGVPAVASRVGGVPEFADDGRSALLVPPGDADALSAALRRLAEDEPLRSRLARGGREVAAAHAWDRIARRYERLYRGAVA